MAMQAANRPEPDDRPGFYYTTIINYSGRRHGLLAGPFQDDHPAALAMVPRIRRIAHEVNPGDAAFSGFGTAWSEVDQGPGILHDGHGWTATVRKLAEQNPQLAELLDEEEVTTDA